MDPKRLANRQTSRRYLDLLLLLLGFSLTLSGINILLGYGVMIMIAGLAIMVFAILM